MLNERDSLVPQKVKSHVLFNRIWPPVKQNSLQFLPGLPEAEIQGPTKVFPDLIDL